MQKINTKPVITVLGGNGFIGSYIVKELAKTKAIINVVARHASHATHLKMYGSVGQICLTDANVLDEKQLTNVMMGTDILVNTIGLLTEKSKQSFYNAHTLLPERIGKLATKYGIQKVIHISSLAAEQAPTSIYAKTKLEGEKLLTKHFANAVILRPSVVFGPEDNFFNLFANLATFLPALPLIGGGHAKMQPVYVNDIAVAISKIVLLPEYKLPTHILELGGPAQYSFKDILQYILKVLDKKRLLVPLPFALAKTQAFFMELMPHPLLTRDQVELLKYNNVVQGENGLKLLGIYPTAMQLIVPEFLAR